jgi:DNA-binding response OmpR family regulator
MKILIIEDEPKIANAIARGLKQEKYVTEVYEDGESGLSAALADQAGEEFALIILDWMLPGLDGIEVLKQIRQAKNKTPIIFLTAKGQIRDKVSALNYGADDYLVKPFSFEELLARVRALLRRPTDMVESILKVADLSLDTKNFEAFRGKNRIKLTTTEFQLLEYLMRNPDRVLSKEKLIGRVWDFDADILPNTVEAYISSLRRKIDKPFPNKPQLIHTLRGFGYKIGEEK